MTENDKKLLNQKWKTANNIEIPLGEMDHQHVSNAYYYWKLVVPFNLPQQDTKGALKMLEQVLKLRFNDVLLPYSPLPDFNFEIESLKAAGYLKENGSIYFEDKIIGCVHLDENSPSPQIINKLRQEIWTQEKC